LGVPVQIDNIGKGLLVLDPLQGFLRARIAAEVDLAPFFFSTLPGHLGGDGTGIANPDFSLTETALVLINPAGVAALADAQAEAAHVIVPKRDVILAELGGLLAQGRNAALREANTLLGFTLNFGIHFSPPWVAG